VIRVVGYIFIISLDLHMEIKGYNYYNISSISMN
jgi:hypothetical protein